MESEEGNAGPPPQSEEAPPPVGEEAPPPPEGTAPTEGQPPPPEGAAAPPPDGTDPLSLSEQGPVASVTDYRSLIPSDEEIAPQEDEEAGQARVRGRMAPRPAQSVLSDGLSQSSRRSSKFRRSVTGIPNLQETLKEKQVCS